HMGYRIELQDIEVALSSLDYINDICCLYDADKSKIVLVVTLNRELVDAQSSILADARKKLPAYMVPGAVRVLKEMPMNANGKIDRVGLSKTL
ncbi:MAG: D-alanine--poly(phosphoribitol) ligase, partial [Bacilli bacterium]|nr:D-alanine--poly(phosphoribitol) ligase [Bacilli bacterium]